MAKIAVLPQAISDMDDIGEYVSRDSLRQAANVLVKILQTIQRLEHFPEIGAFIPEMKTRRFREIHVFNYRIIYRFLKKADEVRVVAIVHAARQLPVKFFRELESIKHEYHTDKTENQA